MSDIVVLAAHPELEHSRVTRRVIEALGAVEPPVRPMVRDLYALYPDYSIDVEAEQRALLEARLVVWLHPIQWYSMPPLMKLWLDEVLRFGWAYGPGGEALAGKLLWLVASTGGPAESYRPEGYNNHAFEDFLPPYRQTAALTGMRFLTPQVLHGAHRASEVEIAAHAEAVVGRLRGFSTVAEILPVSESIRRPSAAAVPASARPATLGSTAAAAAIRLEPSASVAR